MRISDWSSDVCSFDLIEVAIDDDLAAVEQAAHATVRQVVDEEDAARQQPAQDLRGARIAEAESAPALPREVVGLARREGVEEAAERLHPGERRLQVARGDPALRDGRRASQPQQRGDRKSVV